MSGSKTTLTPVTKRNTTGAKRALPMDQTKTPANKSSKLEAVTELEDEHRVPGTPRVDNINENEAVQSLVPGKERI